MGLYDEILEQNKIYKEQIDWLDKKEKQLREDIFFKNENINLDDLKKLSYKEIKVICNEIKNNVSTKTFNEFLNIKKEIKEKEYPEILGVHYYPLINRIDYLTENLKVKIDRYLFNNFRKGYVYGITTTLNEVDNRLLNDLCNLGLVEKKYKFRCDCGYCDSGSLTLTESEVNDYKEYWDRESKDELYDDEGEEVNYGVIDVYCENDDGYEITSLEEFNSSKHTVYYSIKAKPDMTLDNI